MTYSTTRIPLIKWMILGAVVSVAACGGDDKGKLVSKQGDAEVRVNEQGDSATITVKTEEGTAEFKTGSGAELPKDFPTDVPIYPGMKLEFSGTQGNMIMVNGRSADALATVSDSLKAKVAENGWAEVMTMTHPGADGKPGMMMNYTKEKRVLNLVLASQDGETLINVMTGSQ